jgi:hypothetical protein
MNLFDLFAQEYRTKPINQKNPLVALNELIAPVDGYTSIYDDKSAQPASLFAKEVVNKAPESLQASYL